MLKDVWENIDTFIYELNSTNFKKELEKWKWLEYLLERKLWNIIEVFKLLFWEWKSQIQSMLDDYQNICRKHPWKDINITGHSLGWWLAQILSLMEPCNTTYTYNAPWMLNIIQHWKIICQCIEEDWWIVDSNCLEKCLVCIWWKKDLKNEPIYNVTWDILSSRLMTDHIWKSIDIRIDKREYLEHWIRENRESLRVAPDKIFIFGEEKAYKEDSNKDNSLPKNN